MDTKKLGDSGENIACDYLKKNGYKILDRNYVKIWEGKQRGEIDIVAKPRKSIFNFLRGRKDDAIHFIEVKTAVAGSEDFLPEDRVNFQKQKQLIKLSQLWLLDKKLPLDTKRQIDVMGITIDENSKKVKIRHFKNAVEDIH